jgi:hypothetical protein
MKKGRLLTIFVILKLAGVVGLCASVEAMELSPDDQIDLPARIIPPKQSRIPESSRGRRVERGECFHLTSFDFEGSSFPGRDIVFREV